VNDQPPEDQIGGLGEEAAKLLQALQDWAKESGAEYAQATAGAASGAAFTLKDINEHIATGGEDCRYCPVCQVISLVRGTSPEVREHLGAAATSLVHALAGVMATRVPDPPTTKRSETAVERIPVQESGHPDDADWNEEWEDD
jgi:hypothetical protein